MANGASQTPGLRVLGSGTAFVRMPGQQLNAGGWLSSRRPGKEPAMRDRVGRHASTTLFGADSAMNQQFRVNRLLSTEQLWLVYMRVPDVRAAIDAIVRRVATWDWDVKPTLDPKDPGYEAALDTAEEARRFMQAPNRDGETWQELLTKTLIDLMVFDAGVIENVFDGKLAEDDTTVVVGDNLEELVALRGGDIRPVVDGHGRTLGYQQDLFRSGSVLPQTSVVFGDAEALGQQETSCPKFSPRQIVYLRLFPNTSSPEGVPLIEAVVNEIITMLRQSEHSMLAFDADEIPPGILVLTGIAGQAANSATADLQNLRGKDHKIRIITTADPTATGAKWVELTRSPKDVDFVNVVRQIRRTIWRVFGVQPVEMGASEDMPRAVGEVQIEVASSHLIAPILELLEGKINSRILPLVVGDPDKTRTVKFTFDRDFKLSADEQLLRAKMFRELIQEGTLSRNEARSDLGHSPVIGGDIITVNTPSGPVPLVTVLAQTATPNRADDGDDGEGNDAPPDSSGGDGVDDPSAATPDNDEEGPGEVEASKHVHSHAERSLAEDLPSEWQPRGMFRDVRTMRLLGLWESTAAYNRAVEPLFDEALDEILAATTAAYEPGELDEERSEALAQKVNRTIDKLESRWTLATAPMYRDAARVGRDAAVDFTALPVLEDWEERAQQYGERAMQYLCNTGGMLSDLRAGLQGVISAVTRSVDAPDTRAIKPAPTDIGADSSQDDVTEAMTAAVLVQKHRIKNWAGRLVELANQTLRDGMLDGGTGDDGTGQPVAVEWWAEWVNVGDNRMCMTCSLLGGMGFRPLSSLPTVPGGDTECRARCRCVLVLWTQSEVKDGTAAPLSGSAP